MEKVVFTRKVLKSFIYQNVPWVLHDKLTQKHAISTNLLEKS